MTKFYVKHAASGEYLRDRINRVNGIAPFITYATYSEAAKVAKGMGWGWHVDYDGPEDHRCGYGRTLEECQSDIDEMIDERDTQPIRVIRPSS